MECGFAVVVIAVVVYCYCCYYYCCYCCYWYCCHYRRSAFEITISEVNGTHFFPDLFDMRLCGIMCPLSCHRLPTQMLDTWWNSSRSITEDISLQVLCRIGAVLAVRCVMWSSRHGLACNQGNNNCSRNADADWPSWLWPLHNDHLYEYEPNRPSLQPPALQFACARGQILNLGHMWTSLG